MLKMIEMPKTITLAGIMDYTSVPALKKKLLISLDDCRDVLLDLGNVVSADTAFAALLVEMTAKARTLGSTLSLRDVPPAVNQLLTMLRLKPLLA